MYMRLFIGDIQGLIERFWQYAKYEVCVPIETMGTRQGSLTPKGWAGMTLSLIIV